MNPIHWHLMLNHFPFALLLLGVTGIQIGVWGRKREFRDAGFFLVVLGALAGVAVFSSGIMSEDIAQRMLGFPETLLEHHERAAQLSLAALLLAATASLRALARLRRGEEPGPGLTAGAAFLGLIALLLVAWASYRGGQLRHPEIQPDWRDFRTGSGSFSGGGL